MFVCREISTFLPTHAVSDAEQIAAQIDALWDDMPPDALKTGALPTPEAIAQIARCVKGRARPLVGSAR